MDHLLETLCLALALTKRQQEKQQRAWEKSLADRYQKLCSALSEFFTLSTNLILDCGPIGLGEDFAGDAVLVSLYPICEVLSAQGMVFPEQEAALKVFLTNLAPRYNYAQLTEAAIRRTGIYPEYRAVAGLERDFFGSFWRTLFEGICRTRRPGAFPPICSQIERIVTQFARLGTLSPASAQRISGRILELLEYHVNACQQTPYIHALMLLQNLLEDRLGLAIPAQLLLGDGRYEENGRGYYVFRAYEKRSQAYRGRYAVRRIRGRDGALDYENDGDQILLWNEPENRYDLFYQEFPDIG